MQVSNMTLFEFDVFFDEDNYSPTLEPDQFLDHVEEPLFDAFQGDVTPAFLGGIPVLYCSLESKSLGEAVARVIDTIQKMGIHPGWIEMSTERQDQTQLMFAQD